MSSRKLLVMFGFVSFMFVFLFINTVEAQDYSGLESGMYGALGNDNGGSTPVLEENTPSSDPCEICYTDPNSCPSECKTSMDVNNGDLMSSGGSNNNPSQTCQENWVCTSWSDCQNGYQTRYCVDNNKCGTTNNKPPEKRECSNGSNDNSTKSSSNVESSTKEGAKESKERYSSQNKSTSNTLYFVVFLFSILTFIATASILVYDYMKKNKNNRKNEIFDDDASMASEYTQEQPQHFHGANEELSQYNQELVNWIKNAIQNNYSDDYIISTLTSYGWDEGTIRRIISLLRYG